nr:MAG TPA: Guanosine polyphosphate pyrophosphohydrolase/synthetase [Caudoviricetes sp.]
MEGESIIEIQEKPTQSQKEQFINCAASIAMLAHWGQLDNAGYLYFDHCRRVALKGKKWEEVVLGYLHDVIEDTTEPEIYTYEMLRDTFHFPENIIKSLKLITRPKDKPDITYFDYIRELKKDPLARVVKLYDIEDHLTHGTQYIPDSLIERYKKAKSILLDIEE